jgi:hypothetical protein
MRELTTVLNDLGREKMEFEGIDNNFQCPQERKNRGKGNRSGFSMPLGEEKQSSREPTRLLDALRREKMEYEGTDNGSQ